jgi:hypothetical protein
MSSRTKQKKSQNNENNYQNKILLLSEQFLWHAYQKINDGRGFISCKWDLINGWREYKLTTNNEWRIRAMTLRSPHLHNSRSIPRPEDSAIASTEKQGAIACQHAEQLLQDALKRLRMSSTYLAKQILSNGISRAWIIQQQPYPIESLHSTCTVPLRAHIHHYTNQLLRHS